MSKEEKGKKAYQKWKKKFKLSIPKAGEVENDDQTSRAKESWQKRRKGRHGWKENKPKGGGFKGRDLKNNKTKAIEKKFKKRLITKSQKGRAQANAKAKGGKQSKKRR